MRPGLVFNGIDRVDVEFKFLDQRYRTPSYTALIGAVFGGVLIASLTWWLIGVVVGVIASVTVIYLNAMINRCDPEGRLQELTQLHLIWSTMRRPTYTNFDERS